MSAKQKLPRGKYEQRNRFTKDELRAFGKILRASRIAGGYTVRDVALRFDCSHEDVYKWESGRGAPSLFNFLKFCRFYNIVIANEFFDFFVKCDKRNDADSSSRIRRRIRKQIDKLNRKFDDIKDDENLVVS